MTTIIGIVVEHNPLHNGHLYHILESKKMQPDTIVVACMSGLFLQRGEPSILHSKIRTEWMLAHGVDLVVELPYAFSTAQASLFAEGAVRILASLSVDTIVFGSESNNIQSLETLAQMKVDKKAAIDVSVQSKMQQGLRYSNALSDALAEHMDHSQTFSFQPNDILGLAYIEAINKFAPHIKAKSIVRMHNAFGDTTLPESGHYFASATSIRHSIEKNEWAEIEQYVPTDVFNTLLHHQHSIGHWEKFYPFLQYRGLTMNENNAAEIAEISEGLEHRILKTLQQNQTFTDYMNALKTKRYPYNRLQRASLHLLTGATKSYIKSKQQEQHIPIRLLGMNTRGRQLLKHCNAPLFVSNSAWYKHDPFQLRLEQLYRFLYAPTQRAEMINNTTLPIIE
ncbi:MAG: nucleotidyltransferase [Bacilli bacterium]